MLGAPDQSRLVYSGTAEDGPLIGSGLNPLGPAIHQNLADRLKAARVAGHTSSSQELPAGKTLFVHQLQAYALWFHWPILSSAVTWPHQVLISGPSLYACAAEHSGNACCAFAVHCC